MGQGNLLGKCDNTNWKLIGTIAVKANEGSTAAATKTYTFDKDYTNVVSIACSATSDTKGKLTVVFSSGLTVSSETKTLDSGNGKISVIYQKNVKSGSTCKVTAYFDGIVYLYSI